ncbi:MAG: extracellular solute-binding protein [Acidobacteria bacterium]|nr:extracellular solute-binding protein [Acidobacteriota bacterium]
MILKLAIGLLFFLLLGSFSVARESEQNPNRVLTLWLMPSEPPKSISTVGKTVAEDIAEFDKKFCERCPVTVINTTIPFYRNQLIAWNPEFAVPSWAMIKGQGAVLEALTQFAKAHKVQIKVKFVSWGRAFGDLREAATKLQKGELLGVEPFPDVAQIGSTWVTFFAKNNLLIPLERSSDHEPVWRNIPDIMLRASIRYTDDFRPIYFWKRNPLASENSAPFELKTDTWENLIRSLRDHAKQSNDYPSPPMVLQIGRSPDLLHNFAPLVWEGGGDLLRTNPSRTYIELTEPDALKTPILLAENSTVEKEGRPYPILAFPEMSTEEATNHFLQGEYIAIFKPAGFIKRWYEEFKKPGAPFQTSRPGKPSGNFWDYAGVAISPTTFKGGSDLMIVRGTKEKDLAFDLARFLVTDDQYTSTLASYEGYLPAQKKETRVKSLIASLGNDIDLPVGKDRDFLIREYENLIDQAEKRGKEYPYIDSFPTVLESPDILEHFQRLWLRMGQGNADGSARERITAAAEETEQAINQRIDPVTIRDTKRKEAIRYWWPILALTALLVMLVVLSALLYILYQRNRIQALDRLKQVSANILRRRDFVLSSRSIAWFRDSGRFSKDDIVRLTDLLIDLRRKTITLEREIQQEICQESYANKKVDELIRQAWEIAKSQYAVADPSATRDVPELHLDSGLCRWQVSSFPNVLVAALQEWFYNCMKANAGGQITVVFWQKKRKIGIRVISRNLFIKSRIAPFLSGWTPERANAFANQSGEIQAFSLIVDLCTAAFGSRPEYFWLMENNYEFPPGDEEQKSAQSLFEISLPMARL